MVKPFQIFRSFVEAHSTYDVELATIKIDKVDLEKKIAYLSSQKYIGNTVLFQEGIKHVNMLLYAKQTDLICPSILQCLRFTPCIGFYQLQEDKYVPLMVIVDKNKKAQVMKPRIMFNVQAFEPFCRKALMKLKRQRIAEPTLISVDDNSVNDNPVKDQS